MRTTLLIAAILAALLLPVGCTTSRVALPTGALIAMDGTVVVYTTLLDGTYSVWTYQDGVLIEDSCATPE